MIYLRTETGGYRINPSGEAESFPWPTWVDPWNIAFDSGNNLYIPGLFDIQILSPSGDVISNCAVNGFVYNIRTDGNRFLYMVYELNQGKGMKIVSMDKSCQTQWFYQTNENCGEATSST
jgi:hypothetical protein